MRRNNGTVGSVDMFPDGVPVQTDTVLCGFKVDVK